MQSPHIQLCLKPAGVKKRQDKKNISKLIIANSPQQLLIGMNEREVFQDILDAFCDFDNLNIAVPLHHTDCNYYTCTQYAAEETLDPVRLESVKYKFKSQAYMHGKGCFAVSVLNPRSDPGTIKHSISA